jgi:hypothetical protein
MVEIICIYCNKTFKTKPTLLRHQQTAKYCLNIRGESASVSYNCKVCKSNFTRKNIYEYHIKNCKPTKRIETIENKNIKLQNRVNTLEILVEKYEQQIKDLQNKLQEVAIRGVEKPTTSNQTINLLPLTEEHMRNCAQYLTIEHIKNGPIGYAKYALEYPFKDRILCVDHARKKIKYKNNDGDYIVDPHMVKLAPKFFKCIEEHNDQLIDEYAEELREQADDLCDQVCDTMWEEDDRDDQVKKLNELVGILKGYKGGVKRSIGNDDRMKSEFVNQITKTV